MNQAATPDHLSDTTAGLRAVVIASEQLRHAFVLHYAIGATDIVAMSHVRLHNGLNPHELAERIGLTPSAVTSLVDRLQAANFVQRVAHPSDRRMTVITLTDAGEEMIAHADEWLGTAIGRLDPHDLPDLASGMDRLAKSLEQQATTINNLPPAQKV